MPKLSKIRLTGCRYDGLQKKHENSIFDLTKNDEADHSLFTLCNGGGKGVMMQLIFQILLPKTRWGKNNGNKVISMFYDERNNLHPFTFHVVLEWILDTVPKKRLITGIAVKAIMKNTSNEDEEKTGLSYFLYTYEHDNKGPYTIENLPLYDRDTGEGMDLERVEDFINENRRDFIKYSKSSVSRKNSDYYSYLESRGIYRSEWLNLKAINKLEGGSGDYFVGASDNKSIFDKIIIPAISENIKNYSYDDKDNLIEMFRSNLSITKDLPILIKREDDYKELLIGIDPLIRNADMGSRYSDIKDRLINEGNDINFILNDSNLNAKKEIEKWNLETKKANEEKRELLYKKDNLEYNQQKRNVEWKEKRAVDLKDKLKEITLEIEDKEAEKLSYEINKVLWNKKDVEEKIKNKTIEKEKLEETLDLHDIKARAEDLDSAIDLEWEKTKDRWIDTEVGYLAYMNYTNRLKEENIGKKRNYIEKIESLQKEVNKFELKEEDFLEKKEKLQRIYDALRLVFPERILEDLNENRQEVNENIDRLNEKIKEYDKRIRKLDLEKIKFDYQLKNKEKTIEELNRKIEDQAKFELQLSKRIAKQLIQRQEGGLFTHAWFNKKLDRLKEFKHEKMTGLDSIKRTIWEKNIDKSLNVDSYFIPNKDVLSIKEEINILGIHVQTGSEYLNEMEEKDRVKLLSVHPGFLYSLVIGSKKDWEIINKNIRGSLFNNNMVPIYIRSEMNSGSSDIFKILRNKAYDLVDKELFLTWKSELEKSIENLIETKENIEEDLSNIDEIIREIEILNTKDTSLMIKQKIDKEKDEELSLLENVRALEEEKININTKNNNAQNSLEQIKKELERLDIEIEGIEEYIRKSKEIEAEKIKIEGIKKEIQKLKDDILVLEEDNDRLNYNQDEIRDFYLKWKNKIENIVKDVREVYKNAFYDYKADSDYSNYRIPDFHTEANKLNSLVSERKSIEKDIVARSSDIAVLDAEIKALERDRGRYIDELLKLSENWGEYEYLNLQLNSLEIKIHNLRREIKNLQEERSKIKTEVDELNGIIQILKTRLNEIEDSILKTHNRAPVVVDVENIDSEIDMVKRDILSNKKFLLECQEILERNNKLMTKFEINISKIKNGYPLEISKGKIDKILKKKLLENLDSIIEGWLSRCKQNRRNLDEMIEDGNRIRDRFIKDVEVILKEDKLKEKITSTVKDANMGNFKNNLISFNSMKEHFNREILRLSNDKLKAEESMKQWTNRASMHVIKMIDALKNMVSSMNYINEQGHAFPLVKLKGIERLPKEKSEIIHLLDEYFIQSVSQVLENSVDVNNIDDKELNKIMGDKVIFSKALQGRYPTLLVYKMSEKNEFKYARARDEYYTTWEAINKGEGDRPEGSGGQTLSVNTFVIMMIMSFKKKHLGNEKPSTVLILDNPFGKASAKHVLDPIFEIADKLDFQLICFAAPEIIKVEISERFPVFWELKIEEGKVVHGGRIIK